MSASTFRITLLIAVAFALPASTGWAQSAPGVPGELFSDNYDLQFFEPFDLDLNNVPVRSRAGYFFGAEKLYWNISGERFEIGVPNGTQQSEEIFRVVDNPAVGGDATINDSQGTPPPAFFLPNGIQDASPDAEFGYGDRYEFGYSDGNTGILIGVLDGPSVLSEQVIGFGEGFPFGGTNSLSDNPGIDPFFTDTDIDGNGNGIGDGDGPTAPDIRAFGFGSVPVTFNAPEGFFLGFRDYLINLAGPVNGTNTGPIFTNLNAGGLLDGTDDDDDTLATVFFFADDIDGDGNPGGILVTPAGGIAVVPDFDDLHRFIVSFDEVQVRNYVETQGVELMRTFELDNRNRFRREQNNFFTVSYGVRFLRFRDQFSWLGLGSILGETSTATEIDNQLIGPQVALNYAKQRGQWRFEAQGRAFAAYNIADVSQNNLFGGELLPGGINRPLFARPVASVYGEQKEEISPLVELRLNSRYFVTSGVSLNVGYTMTFIDNIHRAGLSTLHNTPGFELANGVTSGGFGIGDGKSHVFINGINFGIEGRF